MFSILNLLICLYSSLSFGLIPVEKAGTKLNNSYLEKGVFVGGETLGLMSLVNIRHSMRSDKKMERLILDLNNLNPETEVKRPNFFQVSIQKNPRRVLIDLQNVADSKITSSQINELLKTSHFFSKAYFYFDKNKKDLTIEMMLKNRAQIEVIEEARNRAIIVDVVAP